MAGTVTLTTANQIATATATGVPSTISVIMDASKFWTVTASCTNLVAASVSPSLGYQPVSPQNSVIYSFAYSTLPLSTISIVIWPIQTLTATVIASGFIASS